MSTTPIYTLNNGVQIPTIGLGVFQTEPAETRSAVATALEVGYRHIDTAAAYLNEREVGQAIHASALDRDQVFIETKVWVTQYGYEETLHAFDTSAKKLGVDQLDLLILHQPLFQEFDRTIQAYRALETLLTDGKVHAIGVSNFTLEQLDDLLENSSVIPAVNQVQVHPFFRQSALLSRHDELGILSQAWSPLGGMSFYGFVEGASTLDDPTIARIAAAHEKTPAQVILAWHLQQGRQVIPKSITPSRIAENLDVLDIVLAPEELAAIDALDEGPGSRFDHADSDPREYGIEIDEA